MVYGIESAKRGELIRIISIKSCQTAILNDRASLLLECMNSSDGECRIVVYGVVNIWKLVGELSDFMD